MEESYIFQITGLNAEQRDRLHNFYSTLPEQQRLLIEASVPKFVKQNNIFRHLGSGADFHYSCRLIAIKSLFDNTKGISVEMMPRYAESYLLTQKRIDHVRHGPRRQARKSSAIRARKAGINYLLEQRLSWPQVSEYAARYWNLKVSAGYLRRVFRTLEDKSP